MYRFTANTCNCLDSQVLDLSLAPPDFTRVIYVNYVHEHTVQGVFMPGVGFEI